MRKLRENSSTQWLILNHENEYFQYPPTTICLYRDRTWVEEHSNWATLWIDEIEHMTEFPNSLRKDLILTLRVHRPRPQEDIQYIPNETNRSKDDVVHFHRTTMTNFSASCFTFTYPGRVPAGIEYEVRMQNAYGTYCD